MPLHFEDGSMSVWESQQNEKARLNFQPCFNLFSIVMQELVSMESSRRKAPNGDAIQPNG